MKEYPTYAFLSPPFGVGRVVLIMWCLCLVFLLPGCIKEDRSDCPEGARIKFSYELGEVSAAINRIDLYIFDSNGVFIDIVTDLNPNLGPGYSLLLPLLPEGTYQFVVWMGLGGEYSTYPGNFIQGETLLTDAMVVLGRPAGNIVTTPPHPLYHALLTDALITDSKEKIFMLPVEQLTNQIVVIVDDAADDEYKVTITDDNGSYKFDGSFAIDEKMEYVAVTTRIGGLAQAELTVMKLGDRRHPQIQVFSRDLNRVVYDRDLIEQLNRIPGINYRTMHRFEIRMEITGQTISVRINGWQVHEQEIPLH